MRLNTLAPIVLTKYVVRAMMAEGTGRVINIASIVASNGYSGLSVYSATKASLIGFTRSLAREVGKVGVTVNAIAPGFMDTDMTHGMDEDHHARLVRRTALRRLAEVDDVAASILFLLGEGGRNITGTVLTIDAGSTGIASQQLFDFEVCAPPYRKPLPNFLPNLKNPSILLTPYLYIGFVLPK